MTPSTRRLPERALETLCMVYRAAREEGISLDEIIVYGSWARGDWLKTSDLDIILVSGEWRGRIIDRANPIMRRLARMKPPLWPQILCLTPKELREMTSSPTHLRDASKYWLRTPAPELHRLCNNQAPRTEPATQHTGLRPQDSSEEAS